MSDLPSTFRVVIIGAGQAGAQAAISLRQAKFNGAVTIIGDEPYLPYQRPPLSKTYLKGELAKDRLYIRPEEFYKTQNIAVRSGERVTQIDRAEKIVTTDKGEVYPYDRLLLATGSGPRRMQAVGANLNGVHYLRTMSDSDALNPALSRDGRIVIVGAGYIGLEVAAVARQAGRDVTLLEMANRVLARVASKPVSGFFEDLHRKAGVDLRLGATVESFTGEKHLTGVKLSGGEIIPCATALIGIGAAPEVALAKEAGLEVDNGIVVDEQARTSDPDIWAAGDCTNFPSPRYGRRVRLESVPNAIEQAKVAGANMAGGSVAYNALPWFWSDQYDIKFQTVGLSDGADDLVLRGDPNAKQFSVWYLKDGKLIAVDTINDPASFAIGKRLIDKDGKIEPKTLADGSVDLKSLLN